MAYLRLGFSTPLTGDRAYRHLPSRTHVFRGIVDEVELPNIVQDKLGSVLGES